MPTGIYRRKQETEGYKHRPNWERKLKEEAGYLCSACHRTFSGRELTVVPEDPDRLIRGTVLCHACDAERLFGEPPIRRPTALREVSKRFGYRHIPDWLIRQWIVEELLPRPYRSYWPLSVIPTIAFLFRFRDLPSTRLREMLAQAEEAQIIDLATGERRTLMVLEEYAGIRLDGHTYHFSRLSNGDLLLRRRKTETNNS